MTGNFKFSIGIPAFKSQFLHECILSILNQSYTEFELIIVNDCSPHPVKEIVRQFNDNRISYYENPKNTGAEKVVDNFNICLEKASGDFFILMGDDDKMDPDYLSEFLKLIMKYPNLDIFHCRSTIIDENSNAVALTPSWPEFESVYDNMWHRMQEKRIQFIADFVYRTAVLKNNGGFYYLPLAWGTDDITSYIAIGDKGIAHTNRRVLQYRRHPTNISSIGNYEIKMQALMSHLQWFKKFLMTRPPSPDDEVIYKNLCDNIDALFQKKKIYTIAESLNKKFLKTGLNWITKRKQFNISFVQVMYSFLEYFKMKKAKTYLKPKTP